MSLLTDQKFVGLLSSHLSLFKKKGRAWSFRCPLCGDSAKNKTKCRGFFFEKKGAIIFKCHNCSVSTSLGKILQSLDANLAKQYFLETFSESGQRRVFIDSPSVVVPEVAQNVQFELPNLRALAESHPARQYAMQRKLPLAQYDRIYYVHNMRELEYLAPTRYQNILPEDSRLIFPFFDKNGKKLLGLTGRALDPKATKRYIQMRIVDEVPLVYGLERLELGRLSYVVEGPIDSLFLPNAIACGGMDFDKVINMGYANRLCTTIVYDNQPRNKDVVKRMRSMVDKHWMVTVWPSKWPYKDINEAVMAGIAPTAIKEIIDSNSFRGLALEMAIGAWKKC